MLEKKYVCVARASICQSNDTKPSIGNDLRPSYFVWYFIGGRNKINNSSYHTTRTIRLAPDKTKLWNKAMKFDRWHIYHMYKSEQSSHSWGAHFSIHMVRRDFMNVWQYSACTIRRTIEVGKLIKFPSPFVVQFSGVVASTECVTNNKCNYTNLLNYKNGDFLRTHLPSTTVCANYEWKASNYLEYE